MARAEAVSRCRELGDEASHHVYSQEIIGDGVDKTIDPFSAL